MSTKQSAYNKYKENYGSSPEIFFRELIEEINSETTAASKIYTFKRNVHEIQQTVSHLVPILICKVNAIE